MYNQKIIYFDFESTCEMSVDCNDMQKYKIFIWLCYPINNNRHMLANFFIQMCCGDKWYDMTQKNV